MPDILDLANRPAPASVAPTSGEGIELVGRSTAIGRVQELLRRSALLDSGVLIVGERGVDAASVAHELHTLSRPAAPWFAVECGSSDAARLDHALFGSPRGRASSDL